MKFKILYWIPAVVYMGVIWYLSSLSVVPGLGNVNVWDKAKHAIEFFILACLVYYGAMKTGNRHSYQIAIAVTIVYGIIDELHQGFIPGRVFSIGDMIADAVGALFILGNKLLRK